MKYSILLYFFVILFALGACQSKMICPAFQSSFIYNDSTRDRLFAYFGEDSLPKMEPFSGKSKFGIIEKTSQRKRYDQIRTVKMEKVFPERDPKADSLLLALDDAASSNADLDSLISANPRLQNHYNVEQENYMRLFGEYLPQPASVADEEAAEGEVDQNEVSEENMTRRERRQARREAKAKAKEEEARQKEEEEENTPIQEDDGQGDF